MGKSCISWAPGIVEDIPVELRVDIENGHRLQRTITIYHMISANQMVDIQRDQLKAVRLSLGLPELDGPQPVK